MVASRAPKSRRYASSPANDLRVSAAVCQKNLGAVHVLDIFKKASLSPGGITSKYRALIEQRRQKKSNLQRTVQFRRRRLFLKSQNSSQAAARQRKEGLSYVSDMATTMERAAEIMAQNDTWLPAPSTLKEDCKVVIVDIETTGFGAGAEIVQIAAKCDDLSFSAYMAPVKPINAEASEKTGLVCVGGNLFYNNSRVDTAPSDVVADQFLAFLKSIDKQVVVVGHNLVRFDAPHICNWLKRHGLVQQLCDVVHGFTDTVPLLKQGTIRKQEELAKMYLTGDRWKNIVGAAHNAEADVKILEALLELFRVEREELCDAAVTTRAFFERQNALRRKNSILPSLLPMKGAVSVHMIGKMSMQGITIEELRDEYRLHGEKGVQVCLGVQINGKPRVTVNKKIVGCVVDYISKL